MLAFVEEFGIDARNFFCNQGVIACVVAVSFHINHVCDVVHLSVTEGVVALEQDVFGANLGEIDVDIAFHIDHWADLQQIEHATAGVGIDFHCKFDFHRTAHSFLTEMQHLAEEMRERHHIVFQHSDKTDDFSSLGIDSGIDDLVGGVVSGG